MNGRIKRLQDLLVDSSVDFALFSAGSDLRYLSGYHTVPSERLTMIIVPAEGTPLLLVPRLEAPRVPDGPGEVVAWDELQDPLDLVASRCRGAGALAIGDQTWSVFLIGLSDRLGPVEWVPGSKFTGPLRMRKDLQEIEALKFAASAVDRVLARIPAEVRFDGRTEAEVAGDLRRMVVEEGHEEAKFAIVASGPNGASPHHSPGARPIGRGDVVVCDFGGSYDGYHSDVTRTFAVGEVSHEAGRVHAVVAEAAEAARSAVAPRVACGEIDAAARSIIADAGYGDFFVHRTGHGIGLDVHEEPYLVEGSEMRLEPGMAFSVEPGIYLSGKFGVRIEDIVICDEEGPVVLNSAIRDLVVVE